MDMNRYPTGAPVDLLQSHGILPVQYFRLRTLRPEHLLMMAVLDDAVRCVEEYRFATDPRGRRLFHEAKQWLLTTEPHWPYCFEHICDVLDLDADAVRHRLQLAPEPAPASHQRQATGNDANGRLGALGEGRA